MCVLANLKELLICDSKKQITIFSIVNGNKLKSISNNSQIYSMISLRDPNKKEVILTASVNC